MPSRNLEKDSGEILKGFRHLLEVNPEIEAKGRRGKLNEKINN